MVVADLDGTLLDPTKQITPRAEKAVNALHASGIDFSVCSGRPARGMVKIVEETAIGLPYGALNGGVIMDCNHTVIHEIRISQKQAEDTLSYFSQKKISTWLFTANDWLILTGSDDAEEQIVANETKAVGFEPTRVDSFTPYLDRAVKIVGVSHDHGLLEKLESEIKVYLGAGAFASRSNLYYLDVSHARANKGEFLQWLSAERGIAAEFILSIGDMPCDAEMFPYSGIGIAMGSAPPMVKERASFTTGTNAADGFAQALEEFVLG